MCHLTVDFPAANPATLNMGRVLVSRGCWLPPNCHVQLQQLSQLSCHLQLYHLCCCHRTTALGSDGICLRGSHNGWSHDNCILPTEGIFWGRGLLCTHRDWSAGARLLSLLQCCLSHPQLQPLSQLSCHLQLHKLGHGQLAAVELSVAQVLELQMAAELAQ